MNTSTMVMLMLLAFAAMAWYANYSKRNQILCTYNRVNKTQITRFVKMQNRYIIFDNKKFDIIPSRIVFRWYNGGFIHMLFPQWIACLTFSHHSRYPQDPNTLEYTAETPETRAALNKTEWTESFFKGAKPSQKQTKQGLFANYLPWIAILLVGLVAFYFNNKMVGFGHTLDQVVNTLNSMK